MKSESTKKNYVYKNKSYIFCISTMLESEKNRDRDRE